MPVTETSKEAYNKAMHSGFIKNLAAEVFAIIMEYGPMTSAMVHQTYCQQIQKRDTRSICPRVTELQQMKVIVEDSVSECLVTGSNAIHWKVATSIGDIKKPKKKMTNKEAVKKLLKGMYDIQVMVTDPKSECTRSNIIKIIDDCLEDGKIGA